MSKKIAILQSNYIPWFGYFDLVDSVDELMVFDQMQFTKRDWRNRNRIKTPSGSVWLTVPVISKGRYFQKISETEIDGTRWKASHLRAFEQNYRRARYYDDIAEWLTPIYEAGSFRVLTELNLTLINAICDYLNIKSKISWSPQLELSFGKTERLVELCLQAQATEYITGPSARSYIDEGLFVRNGIKVTYFDYSGYLNYPQLWGDFEANLSIIDTLFNCGPGVKASMKGEVGKVD